MVIMNIFDMDLKQLATVKCEPDITEPNPGAYPLQLLVEEYTLTGDNDVLERIAILGKNHDPEKSDGDHIYYTMTCTTRERCLAIAERITISSNVYDHARDYIDYFLTRIKPKFTQAIDLVLDGYGHELLDHYPEMIYQKNSFGCNLLMYAVEYSVKYDLKSVIERMIYLGADINAVDTDDNVRVVDCVCLNLNSGDSDVETLNMLVEYGADPIVSRKNLLKIFNYGTLKDSFRFFESFLKAGGEPDYIPEPLRSLIDTAMLVAVKDVSLRELKR